MKKQILKVLFIIFFFSLITALFARAFWAAIPLGEEGSSQNLCFSFWEANVDRHTCLQKKYCGAFLKDIPEGVRHFDTQSDCKNYIALGQPQFLTLFQRIRDRFSSFFMGFFPIQQKNQVPINNKQPVYNCGGFMGTQCPSGYKCKIIGGDAGTCVKTGL